MRTSAPQSGRRSKSSGPGEGDDQDRRRPRPLEQVFDEVEEAGVGPLEVLEQQDGRAPLGDPLEEDPPGGEQDVATAGRGGLQAEQRQEGRLDPAPILLVGDELGDRRVDPLAGRRLVVVLGQAQPAADHLAQRPERDPLAVRRRPAAVPVDRGADPVDVLLELPGEPALADPGRTGDRDEARAPITAGRRDQVLEQAQLLVAADERRLGQVRATLAAALGRRPAGLDTPATGACLPLSACSPASSNAIAALGGPLGRLADEDGPRLGHRLEPGRGVDEVAGDHALVRRPEGHGRLAGQDAGPGLDRRAEAAHGVDQVEAGPDGSLGVVLAGGRRAPDGHHGVADELLDGAAVAADDLRGELEVAGQGVADVLRVTLLGERGEPDEVGEEDRDEAALGEGRLGRGRRAGRPGRGPRAARAGAGPPSGVPHSPQKTSPGSNGAPQMGQAAASGVAQRTQNFRPGLFSVAQFEQITATPGMTAEIVARA